MLEYTNCGNTISFALPDEYGEYGYSVECRFKFDKDKQKYRVYMSLRNSNIGAVGSFKSCNYKIDNYEIDSMYITSTRDTIKQDIESVIESLYKAGFFDEYIKEFERAIYVYLINCSSCKNENVESNERLTVESIDRMIEKLTQWRGECIGAEC